MITDLPILVLGPKYGAWVAAKVAFPYSTCKWLTSTSQNSNNISDAGKGTSCKKSTEQRHARGYMVCRDEPLCFFSLSERGWKRDGGCGCRIRMGRQGWCCPPQLFPAPAFWCHPLLGQVDSLYVSIWCLALSLPTLKKSQFWQKLELQVGKEPITSEWNSLLKKAPTIFPAMIWAFAIHWTSCFAKNSREAMNEFIISKLGGIQVVPDQKRYWWRSQACVIIYGISLVCLQIDTLS